MHNIDLEYHVFGVVFIKGGVYFLYVAWIFLVSFDSQKAAIISFTFDDGKAVQLEKGINLFEAMDIEGSVAIITHTLLSHDENYIGLNKLRELENEGWEVLSHSETHPNFNKINNYKTKSEIFNSVNKLYNSGILVEGFVTPYSECNDHCQLYLNKSYKYAFTKYVNSKNVKELVITENTDPYRLYRVGLDKKEINEVLPYVDYIKENGGWVSFYLHGLDDPDYISRVELEKVIDYCKEKNVEITTPKKAFERIFSD